MQLLDLAKSLPAAQVSIGQVKRDISQLVNRVSFGGERIVLTSRGRPKAALVSLRDLTWLEQQGAEQSLERWRAWDESAGRLAAEIAQRRGGEPLALDRALDSSRSDLEERSRPERG